MENYDKKKSLLILGNGYCLAEGYRNYFCDFQTFLSIFNTLEPNLQVCGNSRKNYKSVKMPLDDLNDNSKSTSDFFTDNVNTVNTTSDDIKNIKNLVGQNNIIVELLNKYSNGGNWSDIEKDLKEILTIVYFYLHLFGYNYLKRDIVLNVINDFFGSDAGENTILDRMYDDLINFSRGFGAFIAMFSEQFYSLGKNGQNGKVYINKQIEKISKDFDTIICFNYYQNPNLCDFMSNNKKVVHIHGLASYISNSNNVGNIVIGIEDGTFTDKLYKRFEKRELITKNNTCQLCEIYNDIENANVYIVYGHSLGLSDKYFFDKVIDEIVNNNKDLFIFVISPNSAQSIYEKILCYLCNNKAYVLSKKNRGRIIFVPII